MYLAGSFSCFFIPSLLGIQNAVCGSSEMEYIFEGEVLENNIMVDNNYTSIIQDTKVLTMLHHGCTIFIETI